MPNQDEVYTITEEDLLASLRQGVEINKAGRAKVRPDRTPSATVRGRQSGDGRALAASSLSLFLCGAGQIYNGQGKLGALMLLTQIFMAAANWAIIQLWPSIVELGDLFGLNEWRLMMGICAVDVLMIPLMLTAVYQSYRRADAESGEYAGGINPLVSGLASLVVPGWGQLVNAQAGKAVFFLFSLLAGAYAVLVVKFSPFLKVLESAGPRYLAADTFMTAAVAILGVTAVMWILSVYDAILVAGFRRRMN